MLDPDTAYAEREEAGFVTEVYPASVSPDLEQALNPNASAGTTATFTKNSMISAGRLFISTAVALILPAFLTHRLPIRTYSAWVLLLQLSAYVGYLDFGVQTGISKFVAEYDAKGDRAGATARASAGLAIMAGAALLGMAMVLVLAWQVPAFFGEMPGTLIRSVRISLVLIGFSLSFGLLASVPSAIFLGLQRYTVPMALQIVNKVLYTAVVVAVVFFSGGFALMGAAVAAVNVATSLLQFAAWRRMAGHVRLSLRELDGAVVKEMLSYCSVLALWSVGMLCVSGLDVTIVGHYDFGRTAFYSIATLPTNFIVSVMGAALGPLLPATSALSATRSPEEMGNLLLRLTRYCVVMLSLCGIPMVVAGYWVLTLWVGHGYAVQTVGFLRILVLANVIRTICLPYATVLVATGRQRVAIAGATAEAVVNVGCSLYLVRHLGAIGVAYGTLLGSCVSVGMHFAVSMHYTYGQFSVTRTRLFFSGIIRPLLTVVPSLFLVRRWWVDGAPKMSLVMWVLWALSTVVLAWLTGLKPEERSKLRVIATRRMRAVVG